MAIHISNESNLCRKEEKKEKTPTLIDSDNLIIWVKNKSAKRNNSIVIPRISAWERSALLTRRNVFIFLFS